MNNPSFHLIARDPQEMVAVQTNMIDWCKGRIAEETNLRQETVECRDHAKAHKWAHQPWHRRVKRHQQKIQFYRRIKVALEAGYYIMPPIEGGQIIAIRTDRAKPTSKGSWGMAHEQSARQLPPGEGEYVSPSPSLVGDPRERTVSKRQFDGSHKDVVKLDTWWKPDKFNAPEFPYTLIRPEIIKATTKAAALRAFDEIVVFPGQRRADPMVIGRVVAPSGDRWNRKTMDFFIAWWFDPDSI